MYLYQLYCTVLYCTVLLYYDKCFACLCRLCDVFRICKDLRKVNKYDMIWYNLRDVFQSFNTRNDLYDVLKYFYKSLPLASLKLYKFYD